MSGVTITIPAIEEIEVLDGRELDELAHALERVGRQVEAAQTAVADRCDRVGHFRADGHRSVSTWMQAVTNCSDGVARARRQTARVLRGLPEVQAAFADGGVGVDQVRLLAKVGSNPRCGGQLAGSESILLNAALELEFADFKTVALRWEQLADADGAHKDHELTHEFRDARLVTVGEEVRFETSHGVLQGEPFQVVFRAFCQHEYEADRAWLKEVHGDVASLELMPRTARQRRADAFAAVMAAAAEQGVGDGQPIEIVVNLVIDEDQFEQYIREQIDETPAKINPDSVRDRRCETTSGVAVDPRQAVAAAFLGRIRRVVVDSAGVVVNAGRTRRLFDGALRQAIMAIDPVCSWLGCNLRSAISQIDHLDPHGRGGPTDAANGHVMCRKHNLFKHQANYRQIRQNNGQIATIRPDGTILKAADAA